MTEHIQRAGLAAADTATRGFGAVRDDGRPPLPGSLHANRRLSQWLRLGAGGQINAYTGKVELGQGILTALSLLVAEELDVPLAAVRLHSASTSDRPDEGVTSGSLSVQDSGGALRHACAALRAMALSRAAAGSGIEVQQIRIEDGEFIAPIGSHLGGYATWLAGVDLDIECPADVQPKPAGQRRLLGRSDTSRVDLPDKVFGRPRYIHDLRPPGLLHARLLRPPILGQRLSVDAPSALASLPSSVRGWVDGQLVALVGPEEREVEVAAARVATQLVWQARAPQAAPLPDSESLHTYLTTAPVASTYSAGSAQDAPWPAGGQTHEAVFIKPYLAHASIGPSCAIGLWDGAALTLWTHSQSIHNLRDDIAKVLARTTPAVPREAITINHAEGAGCYGHNGADDVALDAALLALRCPGEPVRVQWSRADELRHSPAGPAQRVAVRARVDETGRISHWRTEIWSQGHSSRPGRAPAASLLAANQWAQPTDLPVAINPPLAAGGGADRNAVPGYAFAAVQVQVHRVTALPVRTSAMRSLGGLANVWAIESLMDELAAQLGVDALDFRLQHMADERARAVLQTAVARSAWWQPAGAASVEGQGRGLAWARYKNSGAWCAVLAHVLVSDHVQVLALDLVVDVGMAVDADGVLNQIEGGAIQACSWALKEEWRINAQGPQSVDWASYPILRFTELPAAVTVHIVDRPEQPPLGAGECAQGPVVAALANAVSDALGVQIRELPMSPDRLLRAVHAAQPQGQA